MCLELMNQNEKSFLESSLGNYMPQENTKFLPIRDDGVEQRSMLWWASMQTRVQDASFLGRQNAPGGFLGHDISGGQWNTDQMLSPGIITLLVITKKHLKSVFLTIALSWTQNLKNGQYTYHRRIYNGYSQYVLILLFRKQRESS